MHTDKGGSEAADEGATDEGATDAHAEKGGSEPADERRHRCTRIKADRKQQMKGATDAHG